MYSTVDRKEFSSTTQGSYVLMVDSLRPRHEAPKMEPMVHGSWPKVFLFYKPHSRKKKKKLEGSAITHVLETHAHPVKARGTLSHVGLSPHRRRKYVGQGNGRWEEHGGPLEISRFGMREDRGDKPQPCMSLKTSKPW